VLLACLCRCPVPLLPPWYCKEQAASCDTCKAFAHVGQSEQVALCRMQGHVSYCGCVGAPPLHVLRDWAPKQGWGAGHASSTNRDCFGLADLDWGALLFLPRLYQDNLQGGDSSARDCMHCMQALLTHTHTRTHICTHARIHTHAHTHAHKPKSFFMHSLQVLCGFCVRCCVRCVRRCVMCVRC